MTNYSIYTPEELNHHFFAACVKKDFALATYLLTSPKLETHADIHAYLDHAFRNACEYNQLETVKYLLTSPELKEHANIHACDGSAFRWACQAGHLEVVRFLLSSPELTQHFDLHRHENPGLSKAFERSHMDVVNFLLYDMNFQVSESLYEELDASDAWEFRHVVSRRDLFIKMNSSLKASEPSGNPCIKPKI